jgi:hypothetical protein
MSTSIAAGNPFPKFAFDFYYGVEIDAAVANPVLTRIGRPELHMTLPVQSRMRRCLLKDDGTVNYYLNPADSTFRDTSAAADLSGTAGQVMVEIPEHWRRFELDGTKWRVMISDIELPGFYRVPPAYRSAYHATVDRTNSEAPKLASVVNTAVEFRGGNNNAAYDETYRSFLGTPASDISLTNFRTYARNRGAAGKNSAGWNCDVYDVQKTCYWLYVIEYANLNSQAAYNAAPSSAGFRQGGLGAGVTTLDSNKWNTYNGRRPFIPCGYTNALGNRTGVVNFEMPSQYGTLTVGVPSYRGLENPFGHLWSWTDGCKCRIQANNAGGLAEFYVCNDPAKYQDVSYDDYEKRGDLPRANGYIKEMLMGEHGDIMPKTATGASSTTYFSDHYWTNIPGSGEAQRGVRFGAHAHDGAGSGFVCSASPGAASVTFAFFGSRLCFIPA